MTNQLEIRAGHARLRISDKLRVKAISMAARADNLTIHQYLHALSKETQKYYRRRLFPTKLGPEKAYRDDNGKWRIDTLWEGSQFYTLQSVLESNLYSHIRGYLMGLILSEEGKRKKGWKPETIIIRDDDKVAIVKEGKLQLQSSNDWLNTLKKKTRTSKTTRGRG